MKRFNKDNCDAYVRAQITDKWGRTITLLGKYAFNWEIAIKGCTGDITIKSYPKGEMARKHFQELKKKR